MHRKPYVRQGLCHIRRRDPVIRVLGVVVVHLHREAVAADKIVVAAVTALVLGADVLPDFGWLCIGASTLGYSGEATVW